MPTKNPRVNVVLDVQLFGAVSELAHSQGVSMSMIMRDLVKEAMEIREDVHLAHIADQRAQSFAPGTAMTHEEVWA